MADNTSDNKVYFFDKPGNINRFLRVFYVICAILLVMDFVVHRHTIFKWEEMPGFYAIFGFVAFVALVEGSKLLRKLVKRKEDYYDVDE
jgi:hypothetical protein